MDLRGSTYLGIANPGGTYPAPTGENAIGLVGAAYLPPVFTTRRRAAIRPPFVISTALPAEPAYTVGYSVRIFAFIAGLNCLKSSALYE